MISDACFSSKLIIPKNGRNEIHRYDKYSSRWCLTSGRGIVPDGKPNTNSPFALNLQMHLRRAVAEKRNLGVQRLCADVMETFLTEDGYNEPNGAPLRIGKHKGGQFIFTLEEEETDEEDSEDEDDSEGEDGEE